MNKIFEFKIKKKDDLYYMDDCILYKEDLKIHRNINNISIAIERANTSYFHKEGVVYIGRAIKVFPITHHYKLITKNQLDNYLKALALCMKEYNYKIMEEDKIICLGE
jgi:hypothetical protein